ncbi:MAG: methyltransferase domain-containing protein [Xenococcaceae cyanobacterium MO_188.B32]|nr:methyltransferase domain-containing protein [Xenococcaceae cyanobacterium MO_188.B32]
MQPPQNRSLDKLSSYQPAIVAKYFDELGIREWERLTQTPADEVSLAIHTHYLKEYLSNSDRVLEIGAGAGRFTQVLANLGTKIVVADISSGQLELNKSLAVEHGFEDSVEDWQQTDICDLSGFEAESFDVVVAYGGAFSYVLDKRDLALQESLRVIKPGGMLFLSVMSIWGTVHRYLDGVLALPSAINQKITESGDISPTTFPARQDNFMHLFRATELRQWLEQTGVKVVQLSASNCLSLLWDRQLEKIKQDREKWNELLRMEIEACADEGSLNMGTHIIAVARKP